MLARLKKAHDRVNEIEPGWPRPKRNKRLARAAKHLRQIEVAALAPRTRRTVSADCLEAWKAMVSDGRVRIKALKAQQTP
jgi:hypothetical protein